MKHAMYSFTIRIYPTKKQEDILWKHIHGCRFIWNYMLAQEKHLYKTEGKYLNGFDMSKQLSSLKKRDEFAFLNDISNNSLITICRDLDKSYQRYFNKIANLPKFKKRKTSKMSFPIRAERFYFFNEKKVHVEKVGKIRFKSNYYKIFKNGIPSIGRGVKFYNPRITKRRNKWILTFAMEIDIENQNINYNCDSVGVDLGIKEHAVVYYSNGEIKKYHNINKTFYVKNLQHRINMLHRNICRKYNYAYKKYKRYVKSKNIIKQENELRRLYEKITNIRTNYIKHIIYDILKHNPKNIVIEDIKVEDMLKNKNLAKYVYAQKFELFKEILQYKCEWNDINLIIADRHFPSSKMCCECGNVKPILMLSERTYKCDCCGNIIDRDINAAKNLCRYVNHK